MPASPWRTFGSPDPNGDFVAPLSYLPLKSDWSEGWSETDLREQQCPKFTLAEAEEEFRQQAMDLSRDEDSAHAHAIRRLSSLTCSKLLTGLCAKITRKEARHGST
jgi:hypothetical protein